MEKFILGIDIGGTKCAVILGNEDRAVIEKRILETDHGVSASAMIERIIDTADEVILNHPDKAIIAVGISCGGPLDSRTGTIHSPPNLPGWDDVFIVDMVRKRVNTPVFLQNDANACALAEWKFGAGMGCDNLIFLTFGTGMGAGLILDGRLYSGIRDMAGEIGHIRMETDGPVGYGKSGSFEGFCSGGGIAQLAKIRGRELLSLGMAIPYCPDPEELYRISARDVAEWARRGEEESIAIYRKSGRYLGRGLSILIDLLNPERIIIGSIFSRDHNLLYPSAIEIIKEESLRIPMESCEILPAGLGDSIGDIASLAVALNGVNCI